MNPVDGRQPSGYQSYQRGYQPLPPDQEVVRQRQMDFSNIDPVTLAAAMRLMQGGNVAVQAPQQPQQQVTLANGDTYEGPLLNGVPHGNGILKYASPGNRKRYDGEFINGVPNGLGKIIYKDGEIYNGEFKDGLKSGRGKMTWPGETGMYEGMWANDTFHGIGKRVYDGGTVYQGGFVNGVFEGEGEYNSPTQLFIGTFKNGQPWEGKEWNMHNMHQKDGGHFTVREGKRVFCDCCTIL